MHLHSFKHLPLARSHTLSSPFTTGVVAKIVVSERLTQLHVNGYFASVPRSSVAKLNVLTVRQYVRNLCSSSPFSDPRWTHTRLYVQLQYDGRKHQCSRSPYSEPQEPTHVYGVPDPHDIIFKSTYLTAGDNEVVSDSYCFG